MIAVVLLAGVEFGVYAALVFTSVFAISMRLNELLFDAARFSKEPNPRPPGVKGIWGMSPENCVQILEADRFRVETTA